jgi:hypothetical protein
MGRMKRKLEYRDGRVQRTMLYVYAGGADSPRRKPLAELLPDKKLVYSGLMAVDEADSNIKKAALIAVPPTALGCLPLGASPSLFG